VTVSFSATTLTSSHSSFLFLTFVFSPWDFYSLGHKNNNNECFNVLLLNYVCIYLFLICTNEAGIFFWKLALARTYPDTVRLVGGNYVQGAYRCHLHKQPVPRPSPKISNSTTSVLFMQKWVQSAINYENTYRVAQKKSGPRCRDRNEMVHFLCATVYSLWQHADRLRLDGSVLDWQTDTTWNRSDNRRLFIVPDRAKIARYCLTEVNKFKKK